MSKPYRVSLPASREQLSQVLVRLQDDQLDQQDRHLLTRLLHQLLGPTPAPPTTPPSASAAGLATPAAAPPDAPSSEPERKRRGHSRRAAADYSGARRVLVSHPHLQAGERCPDPLCGGHLFDTGAPARFVSMSQA